MGNEKKMSKTDDKPMAASAMGASVALQKLWEKCQEKNTEAEQGMLDILIDSVIERFETMFVPYRFMSSKKKCHRVIEHKDLTLVLQHKTLFECEEGAAEAAIEIASGDLLGGLLVPAENIVKHFLKLKQGIPTREDLAAQVRKLHGTTCDIPEAHKCATHMWVGREVMGAMMRSPDWTPFMDLVLPTAGELNEKYLDALSRGTIGTIKDFGIEVYTDGLRYDTWQVLEGDEWGVFSKYGEAKVWLDWPSEVSHDFKTRKTVVNCTLRIGTEKPA